MSAAEQETIDYHAQGWTAKLGRVPADEQGRCSCKEPPHDATYRARWTHRDGRVRDSMLCLNRAAAWAARHGLTFPCGTWRDE